MLDFLERRRIDWHRPGTGSSARNGRYGDLPADASRDGERTALGLEAHDLFDPSVEMMGEDRDRAKSCGKLNQVLDRLVEAIVDVVGGAAPATPPEAAIRLDRTEEQARIGHPTNLDEMIGASIGPLVPISWPGPLSLPRRRRGCTRHRR